MIFFLSRKILVHLYKLNITCGGKIENVAFLAWPFFSTDPETEKVSPFPFSQSICWCRAACTAILLGWKAGGSSLWGTGTIPEPKGTVSVHRPRLMGIEASERPGTLAVKARAWVPYPQPGWLEEWAQPGRRPESPPAGSVSLTRPPLAPQRARSCPPWLCCPPAHSVVSSGRAGSCLFTGRLAHSKCLAHSRPWACKSQGNEQTSISWGLSLAGAGCLTTGKSLSWSLNPPPEELGEAAFFPFLGLREAHSCP